VRASPAKKYEDMNLWEKTNYALFREKRFIISHKDKRKEKWDQVIMLLAGVNSIMVPLELAFDMLPLFESIIYTLFNVIIDLCFLADMVIMANTDYLNRKG